MNHVAIKKGRKYEQVLEGARGVFLADGYEGASVDVIAKAAGVSKATLYAYFPDKRVLFSEVARQECERQADEAIAGINGEAPVRKVLTEIAEHIVGIVLSDFGQNVFRIVCAESDRFPEFGRQFYESGHLKGRRAMIEYFEEAIARGELAIEDCGLAADQFSGLCKAALFPRAMCGVQTIFTEAEQRRVIDSAVDMFMARYGA